MTAHISVLYPNLIPISQVTERNKDGLTALQLMQMRTGTMDVRV